MKVGMCTADWGTSLTGRPIPGGSCFHRIVQPAGALADHGITTVVTDRFQADPRTGEVKMVVRLEDGGEEVHDGFDVVVFQRWMHQAGPDITTKAQSCGQVVVQDADDWYWGLATTNQAYMATHPKVNPTVNRNHYWKALAKADLITVSTEYLRERLEKLGVPIVVVPNAINLDLYPALEVRDTVKPNVGWVGGVPWRSGDLEVLKGVIGPFVTRHGLSFVHGGNVPSAPRAAAQLGLVRDDEDLVPVVERPMVPVFDYPSLFGDIDIFLAPLADTPFNLAKSNCKLLEASAAGVPWVASEVGPYKSAEGGRLARRPKDWHRHLEALIDPQTRRAQREAQFEWAAKFDIADLWVNWRDAYQEALSRPRERTLAKLVG